MERRRAGSLTQSTNRYPRRKTEEESPRRPGTLKRSSNPTPKRKNKRARRSYGR